MDRYGMEFSFYPITARMVLFKEINVIYSNLYHRKASLSQFTILYLLKEYKNISKKYNLKRKQKAKCHDD
jgi:hypothetical protein